MQKKTKISIKSGSIQYMLLFVFLLNISFPLFLISYGVPTIYKNELFNENKNLIETNLETMALNISEYLLDLQKLATFPYFNKEVIELLQTKNTGSKDEIMTKFQSTDFSNILSSYISLSREDILSMIIITPDQHILYSHRNENVTIRDSFDITEEPWFNSIIEADGNVVFIGAHEPHYFSHSENNMVFSVARVIRHPYINEPLGIVIADSETTLIDSSFSFYETSPEFNLILIDDRGNTVHSSYPVPEGIYPLIKTFAPEITLDRITYRAYYQTVNPSRWRLVALASSEYMDGRIRWLYKVGILWCLLTLFGTFLFFQLITHKIIVKPIKNMIDVMKKVETGDLSSRFSTNVHNELAVLGENLNSMVDNLNEHIETEYKLVLEQKEAEYQALEAQIQPHFLYNTLNGFIGLSKTGKNKILENSISHLNAMLRYTLTPKESSSIKEEFEFIKNYCSLQKLRFTKRLEYSVRYDPELNDFSIPKLLIQPLVENSIIHGMEPLSEVCTIKVTAGITKDLDRNDPRISIVIEDNGAGFEFSNSFIPGIGISNSRERLRISFPGSTFRLKSEINQGTVIMISIPYTG